MKLRLFLTLFTPFLLMSSISEGSSGFPYIFSDPEISKNMKVVSASWFKGELSGVPSLIFEKKWQPLEAGASSMQHTQGFIWYRIKIDNLGDETTLVAQHKAVLTRDVSFFLVTEGTFKKVGTKQKENLATTIVTMRKGEQEYWVRIDSDIDRLQLDLLSVNYFLKHRRIQNGLFGSILLLVILTAGFSFLLAVVFKDTSFGIYSVSMVAYLSYFLFQSGLIRLILPDEINQYGLVIMGVTSCFLIVSSGLYLYMFLEIDKIKSRWPGLITRSLLICTSLLGLGYLVGVIEVKLFHAHVLTVLGASIGLMLIISSNKQRIEAYVIALGWLVLFGHAIAFVIYLNGQFDYNWYLSQSVFFGYMFEILIFNLAILFRLDRIRRVQETSVAKAESESRTRIQIQSLLHMLCHDVANPLTIIDGNLNIMKIKSKKHQDISRPLEKANRACQSIYNIIKVIRVQESIRTGKHEAKQGKITNLYDSVEEAVQVFQKRAQAKGVQIKVEYFSKKIVTGQVLRVFLFFT